MNLGGNGSRPRQQFVRLLPCYTPLLPENLSAPPGSRVKDDDEGERKEGGMDIFSVGLHVLHVLNLLPHLRIPQRTIKNLRNSRW